MSHRGSMGSWIPVEAAAGLRANPVGLRTPSGSRQSGRLLEIPLLFVGSTMMFALFFPMAAKSEHPWLRWPVLGGYAAVLLLLFWVLRGWGRIAATIAILVEAIAWGWIPERLRSPLVLGTPVFFLAAWAVDLWLARRASAPARPAKG